MAQRVLRYGLALLATSIVLSAIATMAAANTVPTTRLDELSQPINANALKPPQCAALNLTAVVSGSGTLNATAAAELVLGGAARDNIGAQGGNDCVLGGGGDDTLKGQAGTDVCIGGVGTDTLDTSCETAIQ